MAKIKKGDTVEIKIGKDKGKRGRVLKVWSKNKKIIVEGLNLVVKHVKPRREGEKGQRIKIPAPLYISKVMLVCPHCHRSTRVGFRIFENKKKARICKKCKEIISYV
ncbi:MAG: 50S ribosomal protein L24 [Patescibacteria group bacterium]|nr:50S ribosomal protein L24 [Patescibacteria group bacterium]